MTIDQVDRAITAISIFILIAAVFGILIIRLLEGRR